MAAILNSAILNLAILDSAIFQEKFLTNSFSLNLMMAAILNSVILDSALLHKKNFTHSFWLNLMMAAILNSTMLDSDTIILDSDTLLSSLRFTQKHSHSTLALTQTNSIWFKLIHSHWTWWWQPSCIMKSWIWPSWIQPSNIFLSNSLTLAKIGSHHLHKKLHSFILTQLDGASHIERVRHCHLGFRHLVIFPQIYSKTLSLHSDSDSN